MYSTKSHHGEYPFPKHKESKEIIISTNCPIEVIATIAMSRYFISFFDNFRIPALINGINRNNTAYAEKYQYLSVNIGKNEKRILLSCVNSGNINLQINVSETE
jgi:hypothetical protein